MTTDSLAVRRGGEGGAEPPTLLDFLAPYDIKLHPPLVRGDAVPRDELVAALRAATGVVVVTAPAGYGKTTLLAQSVRDDPAAAWLTITPEDNDLVVLVAYLARALDSIEPLRPEEVAALTAPGGDAPTATLPRLGRLLAHRTRPFRLVLDDLHLLHDPQCLRVIEVLVSHLSEGSTLVLSSRTALPLRLGRLRNRLEVLELDVAQLVMSRVEAVSLLRSAGVPEGAAADAILDASQGWPAGLYIEARVARGGPGRAGRSVGHAHRAVDDYLAEEVISGLPDEMVEFLLSTCVLGLLDGAACDAILERTGSAAVLDELCRAHLFVVPGTPAGSYQYHPLFVEVLRNELQARDPQRALALHARASVVFEERGDIGAAIRHAHHAGDLDRAVGLVWRHTALMVGSGRGATIAQWLEGFSTDEIEAQAALCAARCWCAVTARDSRTSMFPWLDLLRRHDGAQRLPDGVPVGAMVALLEAMAGDVGLVAMQESAERAIALDDTDRPYRFVATFALGATLALQGRHAEARVLLEGAASSPDAPPAMVVNAMSQLATIAADQDDWVTARTIADRAGALSDHFGLGEQPLQVALFAVTARVAAHERRFDAFRHAANHARRLIAQIDRLAPWLQIQARLGLARAHLEIGEPRDARQLVKEASALRIRLPDAVALGLEIDALAAQVREASRAATSLIAPLTTAELRVLAYLPTHLTYQAIAEDLVVSRNTVKSQTIAIYRKLGVTSRREAVQRSLDLDLLVDNV